MQVLISNKSNGESVRVDNLNTASLTKLADLMRSLTDKDFRKARKVAKIYRKADKLYSTLVDSDGIVGKLQTLSDKEFKASFALSTQLRKADKELERANELEREMKEQRFEEAQYSI